MDRILLKMMRERGIREGLIEKVEEMLGETSCKVKVGGGREDVRTFLDRTRGKAGMSVESFTI